MPRLSISRLARAAVYQRLADPDTGFNPTFEASRIDARLPVPRGMRFNIDFSPTSKNFFQANLLPADLDATSNFTSPYMTLFSTNMQNRNLEKFRAFAGTVQIGINFFVVWTGSGAFTDMETPGDLYEEALVSTFNADGVAEWAQEFDPRIVYNGDIHIRRTAVKIDAADTQDWLQGFYGLLDLEIHTD